VLSDRTIEQTVRLRENQTSIISGIVQSSEMGAINGWPWAPQADAIGALAGNHNLQKSESDLLILITPREVRLAPHTENSIYAGPGEPGAAPAVGGPGVGTPVPENPIPANAPSQTPPSGTAPDNPGGNHPEPNGPGTGNPGSNDQPGTTTTPPANTVPPASDAPPSNP
jgi:general secretion pathway protein D